jgi:2-polyprenyl-3-methyl-5-hydroxy-6-metoxy-1,4-benzoquinol methylase
MPAAEAAVVGPEDYYSKTAALLLERYERVDFESVHGDVLPFIAGSTGSALDVGCGSGRDAAWLARNGWQVVATDRSQAMLDGAKALHPGLRIDWKNDRLPELRDVRALGRTFEFILLSAVWMHIPGDRQAEAAETVALLLAPGGIINLSVRSGSCEPLRGFHEVDFELMIATFTAHRLTLLKDVIDADLLGRPEIIWRKLVLRKER